MSGWMIYWNCRLYRWKLVLMIEVGEICVGLDAPNIITSIRHRHVLELGAEIAFVGYHAC
jgi:hypothetical protein